MSNIPELKRQASQTDSIKLITQAMADIATSQIKARRKSAELNIKYFQEVLALYKTVKQIAINTRNYQKIERQKNGQEVLVLVTSNYKFSGNLDAELINFFIRNTSGTPAEKVVIGTSGHEILKVKKPDMKYRAVRFARDFPTLEELSGLVKEIFAFSKILIYHTRFVTLLNQDPTVTDISASDLADEKTPVEKIDYILEPEIGKMIAFFEDQMLLILLQAIFLESEIARTAARMVSMNQAEQSAEKLLIKQKRQLFQARKEKANMKIVESFAAMRGGANG